MKPGEIVKPAQGSFSGCFYGCFPGLKKLSQYSTFSAPIMSARLSARVAHCKANGRTAFVSFITAGFPTMDHTVKTMLAMQVGWQHSAPNRRWPLDASCCSSHRRFWICSLLDLALPLRSTLAAEYTSPQSMRRQSPAMPAVTVLGPQNSGEGRTKSKSKSAVQDRSLAGLHLVAPGATPTSARPIRCYRCAFRTPLGHTPRGALGWGGSPHRVQLSHPSDGSGHG